MLEGLSLQGRHPWRLASAAVTTWVCLLVALPATSGAALPSVGSDHRLSRSHWVRWDGGTDPAIAECDSTATNPALDDNPSDGDADSNDGGRRRFQEEPFVAVDPTDPDTIVSGFNNGCSADFGTRPTDPAKADEWPGENWLGLGFSRDGGGTWTDSLVPGYPEDTSSRGSVSPIHSHTDTSDPTGAFDNRGNLFVAGLASTRISSGESVSGTVFVSTYLAQDQPSGYPVTYRRTVTVGHVGNDRIFNDKPTLEVDRTGGAYDGNVYVCWTRFDNETGRFGVYFSRSTSSGQTFQDQVPIADSAEVKISSGCDIAVQKDGSVIVTYRVFKTAHTDRGIGFVRSTDGGKTFGTARLIPPTRDWKPYDPQDIDMGDLGCGDNEFHCQSDFVFHRAEDNPRVTADQQGGLPGIYVVYSLAAPGTTVQSDSTFISTPDIPFVAQSQLYMIRSLDNGQTWSQPAAVDPQSRGHQFFADVDALAGKLGVVWEDSRDDPGYSVQNPVGNTRDSQGRAVSSSDTPVSTYFAYSSDGVHLTSTKVSDVGQQTEREAGTGPPFHGDYNWVALAKRADGSVFAFMTWSDNRDVVKGTDPRESFDDGFDASLCWVQQPDNSYKAGCLNGGGTDVNIYGNKAGFPTGP